MSRTLSFALALSTVAAVSAGQELLPSSSTTVQLQRLVVQVPAADVWRVELHAPPAQVPVSGVYGTQKLSLGEVDVPILRPARVREVDDGLRVLLEVTLPSVPERVLTLPLESVPLLWQGTGGDRGVLLTVTGVVNPLERGQVEVPLADLNRTYTRIMDVSVKPSAGGVTVRVQAGLFNPMGWDVVATRLAYTVRAGEREVLAGEQRGLRLRAGAWSDVVLEGETALGDLAIGGFRALVNRDSVRIDGELVLRTPDGERPITIQLGGS